MPDKELDGVQPDDQQDLEKKVDRMMTGDDPVTDKAVDDIAAQESDKLLAIDDALAARQQKQPRNQGGWRSRLKSILKDKRTWIGAGILLLVLLAVPATRYKLLGLVVKKTTNVTVLDNQTGSPVSNALVELGGGHAKTDGDGHAKVKAAVGPGQLVVKKQYYKDHREAYFVGFRSGKAPQVKLEATGRLVPVKVLNKVSGKPLANVGIRILNTTARTDSKGQALVALPTQKAAYPAELRLSNYNKLTTNIQVTDKPVKANTFELTPDGQIYFLSNLGGNIDVVKTNLDGSGRKVILEGTGREEPGSTSLLAARDWRYLVLKSRRDGVRPALYLVDTTTDKVIQFDNNDADFDLVGWSGHNFVYSLAKNNLQFWLGGRQALKSYDADRRQLNQLDQNQAEGDANNYAYQSLSNFYIVDNAVVYSTKWESRAGGASLGGKNHSIRSVQPNGQNRRDHQTFPSATTTFIDARLYEPQAVYFSVYDNTGKPDYYVFEHQAVKPANIDQTIFGRQYPTFLISPSGKQTFWTELRDGENTLFTGNADTEDKKQVATLDGYTPYGWHSDNYLLVSKNNSALYIMPAGGLVKERQPLKITNYYKPPQTYPGYGYGYGGL